MRMSSLAVVVLLFGCSTDDTVRRVGGTGDGGGTATETAGGTDSVDADSAGRCDYTNPFSRGPECKEYVGADWSVADAEIDCAAPVLGGDAGTFTAGEACSRETVLGECVVDGGGATEVVVVFPGDDPEACGGAELGCTFSGGVFVPGEACLGGGDPGGVAPEDAFAPFERVCMDPLPDEPPGMGPDGQVCTWEAISGVTEEGRRFVDYASCETVVKQRPYYSYPPSADTPPDDGRLDDPEWKAELDWVTAQVEASACTCCHTAEFAPAGPSGWFLEDGPVWLDGVDDDGLAMLAGWVDSTAFGAIDEDDNNGFSRTHTGLPTSDVDRMVAFLELELDRRGLTEDDFADALPFGGPLYDQLVYAPGPCTDGEGVAADGIVTWTGGDARYVYVLEPDSMSPGVPPNLDTPDGTLWKLDVPHTSEALPSGIRYGATPGDTFQAWPVDAPAPSLQAGNTYYLVALRDIYQPATRCLFTAR
ncbi:MAG: hypothetical protein ACI9K2_003980 [Myxococcota bacterium]|jgi:hypothetical protein